MTKTDSPAATDIAAHLANSDDWDRQAVLEFFSNHYGLDLSEDQDQSLAIYLDCVMDGGNPVQFCQSIGQIASMIDDETPEERELNDWEANLLAENDRKAAARQINQ